MSVNCDVDNKDEQLSHQSSLSQLQFMLWQRITTFAPDLDLPKQIRFMNTLLYVQYIVVFTHIFIHPYIIISNTVDRVHLNVDLLMRLC